MASDGGAAVAALFVVMLMLVTAILFARAIAFLNQWGEA